MSLVSQLILAFGMSADAFAAAIAKGTENQNLTIHKTIQAACIFGTIEMITPLLGWGLGTLFAPYIEAYDHWIAFILLGGLGAKMVYENAFANDDFKQSEQQSIKNQYFILVITAFATSIDSMIVGVSLAFLDVNIWLTAFIIGAVTAIMAAIGLKLGHILGRTTGKWAGIFGGVLLVGMGTWILLNHLNLLG